MSNGSKVFLYVLFIVILLLGMTYFYQYISALNFDLPEEIRLAIQNKSTGSDPNSAVSSSTQQTSEIVAQNLNIPWDMVFLPDGDLLVTERPGTVKRVGGLSQSYDIADVEHIGEGGLLGVALHPDFETNGWIYLFKTTKESGRLRNQVERYVYDQGFSERVLILDNIPAGTNHNGGRIIFGTDGKIYVTTGDAGNSNLAQDTNSLAGKILRLNDDGSVPDDNPFSNEVWSYGHRNPQGLAWDGAGRLWATEHGRSGLSSGYDELNLIERGKNYGWPIIQGDETRQGMTAPVRHSGASKTWAPGGLAYFAEQLFFAGLRGQSLYIARMDGQNGIASFSEHNLDLGRLRAVRVGPDGYLYISTSNTDGRGDPKEGDDKIIKFSLDNFNSDD